MRGKQLYLFSLHKDNEKTISRPKVILPLDTLILLVVIVILLFTVSFSMGVEKGKGIVQKPQEIKNKLAEPSRSQDTAATINPVKTSPAEETERKENETSYRVQVASFKKEGSVRKEVERLENNGYPVVVMKKGDYLVIYVGNFENENEAKTNFQDLKKRYKDCILRRL